MALKKAFHIKICTDISSFQCFVYKKNLENKARYKNFQKISCLTGKNMEMRENPLVFRLQENGCRNFLQKKVGYRKKLKRKICLNIISVNNISNGLFWDASW